MPRKVPSPSCPCAFFSTNSASIDFRWVSLCFGSMKKLTVLMKQHTAILGKTQDWSTKGIFGTVVKTSALFFLPSKGGVWYLNVTAEKGWSHLKDMTAPNSLQQVLFECWWEVENCICVYVTSILWWEYPDYFTLSAFPPSFQEFWKIRSSFFASQKWDKKNSYVCMFSMNLQVEVCLYCCLQRTHK